MARKKKKNKKGINFLLLALLGGAATLLIFFNLNLWNQRKITSARLTETQEQLENVSAQKEYFDLDENEIDVDKEIEKIAREQLLLKKEGERVIVLSREEEEEVIREKEEEKEEKDVLEKIIDFLPWIDE